MIFNITVPRLYQALNNIRKNITEPKKNTSSSKNFFLSTTEWKRDDKNSFGL
jgi:hypothetical protein